MIANVDASQHRAAGAEVHMVAERGVNDRLGLPVKFRGERDSVADLEVIK